MNIGFVLPDQSSTSGGINIFCRRLIDDVVAMQNCRDHYFFFCQHPNFYEQFALYTGTPNVHFIKLPNFTVRTVICDRLRKIFSFFMERLQIPHTPLYKVLKKTSIDYVFYFQDSLFTNEIPYTLIVWDTSFRDFPVIPVWKQWYSRNDQRQKTSIPLAFRIIIGAMDGKKRLMHFYNANPDSIRIIPLPTVCMDNWTKEESSAIQKKYQFPKPIIFYPAQFRANKNHITLLRAVQYLRTFKHFPCTLVLSGSKQQDDSWEYIHSQIKKMELEDCVQVPGQLTEGEMCHFYKSARVTVFCACDGPDNLPPLEAMHYGCPVVSSRYIGAEDQLGNSALFFDLFDYKQLAEHIITVCTDENLRKTLILRGAKLAAERNFNYAERILETAEEYRQFASMFKEIP